MLATTWDKERAKVRFPLLAQAKLDGIRGVYWEGAFLSRTLKPIATELGCSLAQLSIAWVLANKKVGAGLCGCGRHLPFARAGRRRLLPTAPPPLACRCRPASSAQRRSPSSRRT